MICSHQQLRHAIIINVIRVEAEDEEFMIVLPDGIPAPIKDIDVLILRTGENLAMLIIIDVDDIERKQAIVEALVPFSLKMLTRWQSFFVVEQSGKVLPGRTNQDFHGPIFL